MWVINLTAITHILTVIFDCTVGGDRPPRRRAQIEPPDPAQSDAVPSRLREQRRAQTFARLSTSSVLDVRQTARMVQPPPTPGPTFQSLRATLRPPRAVVVFNGHGDWLSHAALAMYECGQVWGGSAFLLVPHHNGTVNPAMVKMAAAYDPDYVVTAQTTIAHHEAMYPDLLPVVIDGRRLTGEERTEALRHSLGVVVNDGPAHAARELLATACTPHRYFLPGRSGQPDELHEQQHHLSLADDKFGGQHPLSRSGQAQDIAAAVGVPPGLQGPWALAAAIHVGIGSPPPLPFANTSPRDFGDARDLIRRALPSARRPLPFSDAGAVWPSAWAPSETGTVRVQPWQARYKPNLVIVGDSADDFALARGWHVLFGNSFWIPEAPPFGNQVDDLLLWGLGQDMLSEIEYHDRKVTMTSMSVEDHLIDGVIDSWVDRRIRLVTHSEDEHSEPDFDGLEDNRPPGPERVQPINLDFADGGLLVVKDQYDLPLALPASIDEYGQIGLLVDLPPLAPAHADLAERPDLTWQIDVDAADFRVPRMRGVNPRVLQSGDNEQESFVRLSRGGLSCYSASWGFVAAGSTTVQAMAKPRLQFPSLLTWTGAMAEAQGLSTRFSAAGQGVEVLRRLWGSRSALTEDWAGPLRPVFTGFHSEKNESSAAFPDGDGVVIRIPEAYLSFRGMVRLSGLGAKNDALPLRNDLDRLCGMGVIRRGLILRCAACKDLAFIPLDDARSTNTCRRCGADNQLAQGRWNVPIDEPTWWYDLHPAARELLAGDAGVGLLAAQHLRQAARTYEDVSELEFVRGKEPVAEADLLAVVEGRVVLGEAKTKPTFGTRPQRTAKAKKIAMMAAAVRADEVLLCTTSTTQWSSQDLEAIRSALDSTLTAADARPALRTLTGLGLEVADQLHEKPGAER
jgi:hypothetical protein